MSDHSLARTLVAFRWMAVGTSDFPIGFDSLQFCPEPVRFRAHDDRPKSFSDPRGQRKIPCQPRQFSIVVEMIIRIRKRGKERNRQLSPSGATAPNVFGRPVLLGSG